MGYKERLIRVNRQIREELPKKFNGEGEANSIWEQVAKAAGLTLELGGVPVQGERHLITSWGGMAAGVTFAISLLKQQQKRELELEKLRSQRELQRADLADKRGEQMRDAEIESRKWRAIQHVTDDDQKALVAQELAG